MKACVLESVGNLVYKEIPAPTPAKGEVLLRIKACGICSSDYARVLKTGTYHFPTIPGHEFAGKIEMIGDGVDPVLIGKSAVIFPLLPCEKCTSCQRKQWAQCKNYNYFGSRCDGAFAEYLSVPVWNVLVYDDVIPYCVAALTEPAAVAWHAVRMAQVTRKDIVCISGSGTIAILCGLWAINQGAKKVYLTCRSKKKKIYIEQFNELQAIVIDDSFHDTLLSKTNGEGADVVIECVGSALSLETAIRSLRSEGRIILLGNPEGDITLEKNIYWKILRGEYSIQGVWNSIYKAERCDWNDVLVHMKSMYPILEKLITHKFELAECQNAFQTMTDSSIFSVKGMFINE
ncbi:galactitol-1-phosphate 5-dehydrogenase [Oxalobacter formigenes]|uniref:GroES-like protein n=1 Tax=Oxalobacter formigenes OXCC13 TaxID=556269 RepID=C3XA15_OXAFO|nr:galactitol-1-phosphate 5-dehydrogenase [Oxalobacter formigenes]ARQ45821.1 Galactitol-1-phosphate 5-dehydrogenase [Oxalobacter formigenes]ARQ78049.1 galactitol-1-phosphate 5-dehydrogenase [Oxalobacter formigenes OXCC13]EEO30041.1 GroES-like protein [Oxalobacter formigenes OXCC13]MCZ4062271.1 galactitol-1-phosphate 5-dehydrogenase [Oxalobacter formigenes]QDX33403.1 galactitol-1-phosphate 5-dehydrogenase [Oxalobacter formigenes]